MGLPTRFALVGPGRAGRSVAGWLTGIGCHLLVVGSRHGGERVAPDLVAVPVAEVESSACDLLVVAVRDDEIGAVAELLAARPQARVALHLSGAKTAAALEPLRHRGTAIGSLHPLLALPAPLPGLETPRNAVFAFDGDPPAIDLARSLVHRWGGRAVQVPDAIRPLYHLAATLMAGGVVTLLAMADEIRGAAGLDRAVLDGYLALAIGALERARDDPASAITGPVARGEVDQLATQLATLEEVVPGQLPTHLALALATLEQLGRKGLRTEAHRSLEALARKRLQATDRP